MTETARAVVIGGGVVGVSCLLHLARAGWGDCVLLEGDELTAGSTWHAAGNVPTFSASASVMAMQRYSTALYRQLEDEGGEPIGYNRTGSLRLAHGLERMRQFEHVAALARRQGTDYEVLSPAQARDRYPFLETHDLAGVLWDPDDGDIDPARLTQALAAAARRAGATIHRFRPATGARRDNGEWVVETPAGPIRCEVVVNAAGYRAAEVGAWFGRTVPMAVMEHQYLLFDTIPELDAWSREAGRKLPLLRDPDTSWYLRQEKAGMNLGPYERPGRSRWHQPGDPMPADFSFQLFADDLDRLEFYMGDAAERVPILATAGLSRVINGPIPYAPDGNPLIGPMPGVPDAFEACVFTFGICQAGGAGRALAEWVTEGASRADLWSCDPRRFTGFEDDAYCIEKAEETYGHEYAVHFPTHAWPAARGRKTSPLHGRMAAAGAQFAPYAGWERATWFARAGDDASEEASRTFAREGPWFEAVAGECAAVAEACGVLDLPGFSRFDLEGPGAADWLSAQITGRLPAPGRLGLGYFADERGRIVTEMSVIRHAADRFTLITAAVARVHDREWLTTHLPAGGLVTLTDRSDELSTLIVTGPRARDVLAPIIDGFDLRAPWLSHGAATIGGRPAHLMRVSFAGELGWEIHAAIEAMPAIHAALLEAGTPHGLAPFGMFALDSLRLEKGWLAWKAEVSSDYTPAELALDRFIDLRKPDFRGRAAMLAEAEAGTRRRLVTLVVETGACDAPYLAPVHDETGRTVGDTLSGGFGHRTGRSIALAMVETGSGRAGTRLHVDIFGERCPATVAERAALYDPANERLRA